MTVTKDQAIVAVEFHYGTCQNHIGIRGGKTLQQIRFRRNGKTKTWVTRPDEFRVPIKHGLREYGYITQTNAKDFHTAEQCEIVDISVCTVGGVQIHKLDQYIATGGWFPPR